MSKNRIWCHDLKISYGVKGWKIQSSKSELLFKTFQAVMRDLIKRYIMAKQRSPQRGEGVTEDDINELKQDISSFRYELLEILRNNGMKTPNLNQGKPSSKKNLLRYWKKFEYSESFDSLNNFNSCDELHNSWDLCDLRDLSGWDCLEVANV